MRISVAKNILVVIAAASMVTTAMADSPYPIPSPGKITVSASSLTLKIGQETTISAYVTPASKYVLDIASSCFDRNVSSNGILKYRVFPRESKNRISVKLLANREGHCVIEVYQRYPGWPRIPVPVSVTK